MWLFFVVCTEKMLVFAPGATVGLAGSMDVASVGG